MLNKKILIIEDEAHILNALNKKFTMDGFNVLLANDGESGLVSATTNQPNVILLDIIMPNMNGFEMLEKLRHNNFGKNIPVIILTNLDVKEDSFIKSITEYKVAFCLTKSNSSILEISRTVKEVLNIEN
ncbi:MAG: response regulator [Patescibacteria group bacterium]